MTTWIYINQRVVIAIRIQIQTQWIRILTCIRISRNKSTSCRVIISSPQINRAAFRIIIFTAIPERIRIRVIDILLHTKRIIRIRLGNCTGCIGQINYIAMCILRIVGISGLFAIGKANQLIQTVIGVGLSLVKLSILLNKSYF